MYCCRVLADVPGQGDEHQPNPVAPMSNDYLGIQIERQHMVLLGRFGEGHTSRLAVKKQNSELASQSADGTPDRRRGQANRVCRTTKLALFDD